MKLNWWFQCGNALAGEVVGHPKVPDHTFVHTSAILSMDEAGRRCETTNTIYELGDKLKVHRE